MTPTIHADDQLAWMPASVKQHAKTSGRESARDQDCLPPPWHRQHEQEDRRGKRGDERECGKTR